MHVTPADFGGTLRKFIILSIFMIVCYTIGTKILSRRLPSSILAMAAKTTESVGKIYEQGTFSVAFVTTPNDTVAKNLARYEWQGKINEDSECMMIIKTRSSLVDELSSFIRQNHPYDVAEVISLPITSGNPPYLKWLDQTIKNLSA